MLSFVPNYNLLKKIFRIPLPELLGQDTVLD